MFFGSSAGGEVLYEDARITGQQIHVFEDLGETANLVLGDFRLIVGSTEITGRDGVVWVATRKIGRARQYRLTVYVEGDAQIVESGKGTTGDNSLLVTMDLEGSIRAGGNLMSQPLKDLPLYQRALQVRQEGKIHRPTHPEPEGIEQAKTPDQDLQIPPPAEVAVEPGPVEVEVEPAPVPVDKPETPMIYKPINYSADSAGGMEIGEGDDWRQVVVLRGNVYVSQGDPDSDLFLEIRSQEAVMFFRRAKPGELEKDTTSPFSLPLPSGERTAGLVPEGVYLEGDVVLARGERYFRGEVAYYDFVADRAVMHDAVLRTIQEQREIPVYVRAQKMRMLSARQAWFRNVKVSSSDFYTPSYHVGATTAYFKDLTPYDEQGQRIGPRSTQSQFRNSTFNVAGVPIFYWPFTQGDFEQGHTALRKAQMGRNGDFGWGIDTQWHLFRLLGLVAPEGYRGSLDLEVYEKGLVGGTNISYAQSTYSGYNMLFGAIDRDEEDDFGDDRKDINAPRERGRALVRHKQILAEDWLVQLEMGYVSDANFMEAYFPTEQFAGKEQETLAYLRRQQDNWAFTALMQYRLNRFDTQTESAPDLGFLLIGQPLLQDRLSLFSESHAGMKRWRPADSLRRSGTYASDIMERLDSRNELTAPMHLGPLNVMPYATGRLTHWGDAPAGGENNRAYGQLGLRTNTHIWRIYEDPASRLLDINRLRHVITPEFTTFVSDHGGTSPDKLFAMDPDIEQHLLRLGGAAFGLYQRLQTKRGPAENPYTVDWMRLNIIAGFYQTQDIARRSNGEFFWYRPEYSLGRNHVNTEYSWQISDSTSFLADANYDTNRGILGHVNAGIAVERSPRLKYFVGWRWLKDLDSSAATVGFDYQLTRKYSISLFEQYDFTYNGRANLATRVSLIRKMERWYAGLTVIFVQNRADQDELALMLTIWPEGIPELRFGSERLTVLGTSDKN